MLIENNVSRDVNRIISEIKYLIALNALGIA